MIGRRRAGRLQRVAHGGARGLGARQLSAGVASRERVLVDEPRRVSLLDRLEGLVIAPSLHARAAQRLRESTFLEGRVELSADGGVVPGIPLTLVLEFGDEVPAHSFQGRVAEGVIEVPHAVSLRGCRRIAVLDEGVVEGLVPGLDEAGAELVRRHPVDGLRVLVVGVAVVGVGVLLAPEAVQARRDVADARVAVVLVSEGRDEVQEHLLNLRVVVVGGERDTLVVVEVVRAARVRACVDQVLGHAGLFPGGVQGEADDSLVSARRDRVQEGVDLCEVVGVASGDDGVHGEGRPLERVGQGVCDRSGCAPVLGRPRHEALHRVRHRGGGFLEDGPLGGGGRRGRGRQGGTRQSCGRRESDGDASKCSHREVLSVCTAAGDVAAWARRVEPVCATLQ